MRFVFIITLFLIVNVSLAQKYTSDKSIVTFYSHAPIEDIMATNTKSSSIFDLTHLFVVFSIPIKDFQFAKRLMQEHFNEKYMETEKYPNAIFQGKLVDFNTQTKDIQQVKAHGKMTIHGVTKEMDAVGTVEYQGDIIVMKSIFIIVLEDYMVSRPQLLWKNIAEKVEVTIEFTYIAKTM
ncbi:MAG: hypothetical protein OJF59_002760 [Cytophagales bacterium]|jgi:hypothetical protein|nr:YceI family protein [Bacteroidota bacterium]WHZ09006.1 MAG: hypothetical protein OJF59_002760 [Cytophagales bacterium]